MRQKWPHDYDGEYTVVRLVRRIAEDTHRVPGTERDTCRYCGAHFAATASMLDPHRHDGDCLWRVATALITRLDAQRPDTDEQDVTAGKG